jgi:hypothetical protein
VEVAELKDWDKHPTGMLVMHPVLTAGVMPVTSGNAALRFEYATSKEEAERAVRGQSPAPHIQLALSLPQIEELVRILENAAKTIRTSMSGTGKTN